LVDYKYVAEYDLETKELNCIIALEASMRNYSYKKEYPFCKSVFIEKFTAMTVPLGIKEGLKRPYGRKLEGRVFMGEIRKGYFRIVTFPDIYRHSFWKAPSCICGILYERDGNTVVDFTVDILEASKFVSVSGILMSCLGTLASIISVLMERFHIKILLAFAISLLIFIKSISTLQVHESEHDALLKFMEDMNV